MGTICNENIHYDNGAWFLIGRQGLEFAKFAICRRVVTYALMGFIVIEDPKVQFRKSEFKTISGIHFCYYKFPPMLHIPRFHRSNDNPFHD